jgi:hypothetical protein
MRYLHLLSRLLIGLLVITLCEPNPTPDVLISHNIERVL